MFEKSVFSCNFLYVNNQDRLIQTASTSTSKMFREKCLPLFIASVSPPPDETINVEVTECTKLFVDSRQNSPSFSPPLDRE